MYVVTCDNAVIYSENSREKLVKDCELTLELNKAGTFEFTIYPKHPQYNNVHKMLSTIRVYSDGRLIFKGRPLNTEVGWLNEKSVMCEGELAFLNDSIVRPYNCSLTIASYLNWLITNHNSSVDSSRQFTVGSCDVVDGDISNTLNVISRSSEDYVTTLSELLDKLVDSLGGYIVITHEGDNSIINYYKDISEVCSQPIVFGENLLDVSQTIKGEDVATALIPLGKKTDSGMRVTIATINGGIDYLVNEATTSVYGKIFKTVIWDDIDNASALLSKAREYLPTMSLLSQEIEVTAVDLEKINSTVEAFRIGTRVIVNSSHHGIVRQSLIVSKLKLNLLEPWKNTLSLGDKKTTLTDVSNTTATDTVKLMNSSTTMASDLKYISNVEIDSITGGGE